MSSTSSLNILVHEDESAGMSTWSITEGLPGQSEFTGCRELILVVESASAWLAQEWGNGKTLSRFSIKDLDRLLLARLCQP